MLRIAIISACGALIAYISTLTNGKTEIGIIIMGLAIYICTLQLQIFELCKVVDELKDSHKAKDISSSDTLLIGIPISDSDTLHSNLH